MKNILKKIKISLYYSVYMPFFIRDKFYLGCLKKNPFIINSLLYCFDVPKKSIIFDVGGYKGEWSEKIIKTYPNSSIYIFEPVQKFANQIKELFKNKKNININNFGLSGKDEEIYISLENESSSIFKTAESNEKINLKDIYEFIKENKIDNIDLIKINIEGGEYSLLQKIIDEKFISNCNYILVQFHDFVPDANFKRDTLVKEILKTHQQVFSYPFIWELYKKYEN